MSSNAGSWYLSFQFMFERKAWNKKALDQIDIIVMDIKFKTPTITLKNEICSLFKCKLSLIENSWFENDSDVQDTNENVS